MEIVDVAIVGGGPAGASCAAFCAAAGLRTLVLEREKFPREKVCGDCINPACWPVLERLDLVHRVRSLPHAKLEVVDFIAIGGESARVDLPSGEHGEIAVKRSLFDNLLFERARELGACAYEEMTVTAIENETRAGTRDNLWRIHVVNGEEFFARILVAADGRNSTVARLCGLSPRPQRERIALQSHI